MTDTSDSEPEDTSASQGDTFDLSMDDIAYVSVNGDYLITKDNRRVELPTEETPD